MVDEETFDKTMMLIGRLLGQDRQLQALYYMLLMVRTLSSLVSRYSGIFQLPLLIRVYHIDY